MIEIEQTEGGFSGIVFHGLMRQSESLVMFSTVSREFCRRRRRRRRARRSSSCSCSCCCPSSPPRRCMRKYTNNHK